MTLSKPLLVLTLAWLPALAGAAPLAAPPSAARAALDEKDDEFRRRFQEAMKINAKQEMSKLVRSMTEQAVFWIIDTAKAISNQTNEELETRMAALREAWKDSMETDFCTEMYEYFSLLQGQVKVERDKLQNRYAKARKKYVANLEPKDGSTFGQLSIEFKGIAEVFEKLGDKYHASQAWIFYGSCNRGDIRGGDEDPYAVCLGYKKAYQLREEIGLKDSWWVDCKAKYQSLAGQGFDRDRPAEGGGGGGGPAGGGPAPVAPEAAGSSITAAMAFEPAPDLMAYERVLYSADELYQTWNKIHLSGKGSTGKITPLGSLSPTVLRKGSNEVLLDLDGDGAGDEEVPLTGNSELVTFEIGQGAEKRPWAFLTTIGTQQEIYQSVQTNLAPTDDSMAVYFVPAASVQGDIGGTAVRVFDDNADGIYGSEPTQWGYTGLAPEALQPELDSVSIGGEERCVPWSKYLQVGDQWYDVAAEAGGTRLVAKPVALETGTLKLKYKGGRPTWMILRGKGRLEGTYIDIAEGKGEVPAGMYELYYGELRQGKKRQMVKAVILPGPSTPTWSVGAGETVTVELGAPFSFDFDFDVAGDTLTVTGKSVVVVGAAGERYTRLWECVPNPEVSWREAGSRRGSKGEDMERITNQFEEGFWDKCWYPLDLALELKGEPEAVEVQLVEKKNRLFGKIESDWKAR